MTDNIQKENTNSNTLANIDYNKFIKDVVNELRNNLPTKEQQEKYFEEFSNKERQNNLSIREQVEKEMEQEKILKQKEQETIELTEYRLKFNDFLNEYDAFIDEATKREIAKVNNDSERGQAYKMSYVKSLLVNDTFSNKENYEKLIDSDKKEIDTFLSLRDTEKQKQYKLYFPILERFLDTEKRLYREKAIAEANKKGAYYTDDKEFYKLKELSKMSAKKFQNIDIDKVEILKMK